MSDKWLAVRRQAAAERARLLAAVTGTLATGAGRAVAEAALAGRGLCVLPYPPDAPVLHGCRAVFKDYFVAYSSALSDSQIVFSIAHELGHIVLGHEGEQRCADEDIDEQPVTERLPYAAGAVDVYNPRQQRELEANVFATTFLLPPDELRQHFVAGEDYQRLASRFGVSVAATLNALATTLLAPQPTSPPPPAALAPLDPSQKLAAEEPEGPVLVNAGPGTGKTRTLVGRVLHLLEAGVPARQILAVTFSNRATNEMRERVQTAAPQRAQELTISTFHAFCHELLRRYHEEAGLPADFTVIDGIDAILLLERNLGRLGLELYFNPVYPELYLKDIVRAISRAKDELVTPTHYAQLAEDARRQAAGGAGRDAAASPTDEETEDVLIAAAKSAEVARVYGVYERLLAEHGFLDFGGLIMRTVVLLRDHPEILAQLRQEYRHILVDEYQDMNRASAHLLQLLAGDGKGLWVVGDLRQAIYRFRGASPANIVNFERDFPGGRTRDLGINYRSDPALVSLFRAAGDGMALSGAAACTWEAFHPSEPPPRVWLVTADDGIAEAEGIAGEILRRRKGGRPFREQAVLVRTHTQAELIAAALERNCVPVLYLGDLYGRGEVRNLLALMALADGDRGALLRVGAMEEHWLSRDDRVRLIRAAQERQQPFPSALALDGDAGLVPAGVAAARGLRAALSVVGSQSDPWQFLARYLFGHGALVRRLLGDNTAAGAQQLMAIGQLLGVARAFSLRPRTAASAAVEQAAVLETEDARNEEHSEEPDEERPKSAAPNSVWFPSSPLGEFLAYVRHLVALDQDSPRTPDSADGVEAVRLLTVHAAKGLEFPVVYVPNLAKGRFPHQKMRDAAPPPPGMVEGLANVEGAATDEEQLEELCLFFVAISRAKKDLIFSRAARYGKRNYAPSLFLELLGAFFDGAPPVRVHWASAAATEAAAGTAGAPKGTHRRRLRVWEVELYRRCPRRYEYQYALSLPEREEELAYKRFHDCVNMVIARLRHDEHGAPLGVPGVEEASAALDALWATEGPAGHPYEALYRAMAERLVGQFCEIRAASAVGRAWRDYLDVTLGGAVVRVPIDASEVTDDGALRIIRTRTGRPKDDDRKEERLSLLRAAAGEQYRAGPMSIELEYVATGETATVPAAAPRYERQRIASLEDAVAGIMSGAFPAQPREQRDCLRCPYWVVCPS